MMNGNRNVVDKNSLSAWLLSNDRKDHQAILREGEEMDLTPIYLLLPFQCIACDSGLGAKK